MRKIKPLKKLSRDFCGICELRQLPIAVTLVTDELVNKYERKLILSELFSQSTLESIKK